MHRRFGIVPRKEIGCDFEDGNLWEWRLRDIRFVSCGSVECSRKKLIVLPAGFLAFRGVSLLDFVSFLVFNEGIVAFYSSGAIGVQ